MNDRKQEIYKKGGFQLCPVIEKGMVRTHGIGARIVPSGQHRIIKKYKENRPRESFVISVKQKKNEEIAQNSKLISVEEFCFL